MYTHTSYIECFLIHIRNILYVCIAKYASTCMLSSYTIIHIP